MKWRPLPEKTNSPLNGKQYLRNPKVFLFHSQINMDVIKVGHGLRTPNEGINQRYLKNWANVADKIGFGRT